MATWLKKLIKKIYIPISNLHLVLAMALILSIETATETCSVALSHEGELLSLRETSGNNEHSSQLTLFIAEVMQTSKRTLQELDAVAVSMGPGSYTGLRIGASAAKGLCYALDKPLIAVSTLQSMALNALLRYPVLAADNYLLCPMIDARRMEVYTALFNSALDTILPVNALLVKEDSFAEYEKDIAIFGNGASKCREMFSNRQSVVFPGELHASATSLSSLAYKRFLASEFENVAYFEPLYLKDFIAAKPRVKGLD